MEMVAAAKLRRFQDWMVRARPYTEGLEKLLRRLLTFRQGTLTPPLQETHPFFQAREEKKFGLLLITSDTGLCGSYNQGLVETAKDFLERRAGAGLPHPALGAVTLPALPRRQAGGQAGAPLHLIAVGKWGINAMKRLGFSSQTSFTDLRASRLEEVMNEVRLALEKFYLNREINSLYVVHSHFLTVTSYRPVAQKLLPLESAPLTPPLSPQGRGLPALPRRQAGGQAGKGEGQEAVEEALDYIMEPSPEIIFKKLVPLYFEAKLRLIFLESFVSEQIARMQAMHQATENAKEMIDSLVLARNKARQAAITKEIIEIVSGSRALKIK